MSGASSGRIPSFLQEYSLPLIGGVIAAMIAANVYNDGYHDFLADRIPFFGISIHFLINDIFMVLFFGIAAKEITEACLPGGDLNPLSKAINPLFGCLGGILGPVLLYAGLAYGLGYQADYGRGWGIPTATDIALAWLVARLVFGAGHPAVNYLLLLAVADDAIGLGIIAIFYPDPAHPAQPVWLLLTAAAMALAYGMRRARISMWQLYILGPGVLSWWGLHGAHLHPALALVFVVPFMPAGRRDNGLFCDEVSEGYEKNPLHDFEHSLKSTVDFGLFFFAYANAGVAFSYIGPGTWLVFAALFFGKTAGITALGLLAVRLGFPLPQGMNARHLVLTGLVAGMGLTVALFVAGEALTGTAQAEAKMGALFSALIAFVALALGPLLGARAIEDGEAMVVPVPLELEPAAALAIAEAKASAMAGAARATEETEPERVLSREP